MFYNMPADSEVKICSGAAGKEVTISCIMSRAPYSGWDDFYKKISAKEAAEIKYELWKTPPKADNEIAYRIPLDYAIDDHNILVPQWSQDDVLILLQPLNVVRTVSLHSKYQRIIK